MREFHHSLRVMAHTLRRFPGWLPVTFSKGLTMKKAILSIAMFAAFSGAAVAAPINAGNVLVPSFGNFLANVEQSGNLNQVYYFNLQANAGSLSASYNSDPVVGGMTGQLYASNANGDLIGSALANFGAYNNSAVTLSYGAITAGYYAFKFASTSSIGAGYSGQFSARVPAPAALGLAGLGLVGLGLFSRRRAV